MSNTKGSMLISNANAVGTELVNQLGGTGYTPAEWADAINLLGISDDDKASALAGITSGTYTGTERGSIKYSNCNAVGAMLNKKFSTNRGFKPVEWESAISKLTPLAEGTVSGAICNIVNGADDVPMKSVVAHIAPNLIGVNAVNMVQTGKNLIKPDKYQTAGNNLALGQNDGTSFGTFLKAGTYTISYETTGETCYIYRREENDASNTNMGKKLSTSFTIESDGNFRFWLYGDGAVSANISNVQIEVGNTASTYKQYTAPTTYTANLGRTVYGADADLVSGQGKEQYGKIVFDGTEGTGGTPSWTMISVTQGTMFRITVSDKATTSATNTLCSYYTPVAQAQRADGTVSGAGTNVDIIDDRFSSVDAFKAWLAENPVTLVYELATGTSFTFDGQEIPSLLGVNNLWSEQGDSSITYRKDPDIPDPPVQLLNMNNNNEDNNEGV